jgi:hypothetical protein
MKAVISSFDFYMKGVGRATEADNRKLKLKTIKRHQKISHDGWCVLVRTKAEKAIFAAELPNGQRHYWMR